MSNEKLWFGANVVRGVARHARPNGARSEVTVGARIAGHDVTRTFEVTGPADVRAVGVGAIARRYPANASVGVPPTRLASLELAEPTLAWSMSPSGFAPHRVLPWLTLLVLEESEAALGRAGEIAVVDLRIERAKRPNGADLWAWAHLQASKPELLRADHIDNALTGKGIVGRLIAPRRLEPERSYLAVLVPTFAVTVDSIFSLDVNPPRDERVIAWEVHDRLPYFSQWTFRTGRGGDFETYARALRGVAWGAVVLDPLALGRIAPGVRSLRPVVLAPVTTVRSDFVAGAPHAKAIAAVLNRTSVAGLRILKPPVYGTAQLGKVVIASEGSALWIHRLNVDPSMRASASFGASLVQREEEELMRAAWAQAEAHQSLNRAAAFFQLAREVSERLVKRFVSVDLASIAQLQGAITMPDLPELGGAARGVATGAFRRLLRSRGPLAQRLRRTSLAPVTPGSIGNSYLAGLFVAAPTPLPAVRTVTVDLESGLRDRFRQPDSWEPGGRLTPAVDFRYSDNDDSSVGKALGRLGTSMALGLGAAYIEVRRERTWSTMHAALLDGDLRPAVSFAAPKLFDGVMDDVPGRYVPSIPTLPGDTLDARTLAPQFTYPIFEVVRRHHPEWLAVGLDRLAKDQVALAAIDHSMVEALMVGMNHQMASELLWRRHPARPGATFFRNFWPTGGKADFAPIREWTKPLGGNQQSNVGLVLLVRSELFRCYPDARVVAARSVAGRPSSASDKPLAPLFRVSLGPDVVGFAFALSPTPSTTLPYVRSAPGSEGWYFVIAEAPQLVPPFGVDETMPPGWLSVGAIDDSAAMASALVKRSYLVARHADDLIP